MEVQHVIGMCHDYPPKACPIIPGVPLLRFITLRLIAATYWDTLEGPSARRAVRAMANSGRRSPDRRATAHLRMKRGCCTCGNSSTVR